MLFMDNAALSSLHLCFSCPWKKQQRCAAYHSKNIKNKHKRYFFLYVHFMTTLFHLLSRPALLNKRRYT